MKIWIQITLHSTEHRDVYVQYTKMHGYGLYSTNDNDNQASTTIWQETKTTTRKKNAMHDIDGDVEKEREKESGWMVEWKNRNQKKSLWNQKKTKMC